MLFRFLNICAGYEATEKKPRPLLITLCFTVCVLLFVFAREDGYWVVPTPFLPLTFWMGYKVYKQRSAPKAKTE